MCDAFVNPYYLRKGREDWFGGSASALVDDLKNGRPDWTKEAERIFDDTLRYLLPETSSTDEWDTDVSGFTPCVPNYVAGQPDSMWNCDEGEGLGPVRVFVDCGCAAGVKQPTMQARGLKIAAFAYTLQTLRPVELYLTHEHAKNSTTHSTHVLRIGVSPIDLSTVAVLFGHIGIGRRLLAFTPLGSSDTVWGRWSNIPARQLFNLRPDDVYFPGLRLNQIGEVDEKISEYMESMFSGKGQTYAHEARGKESW
jgi:hypothetical protein